MMNAPRSGKSDAGKRLFLPIGVLTLGLLAQTASAADTVWIDNASKGTYQRLFWADSANWQDGLIPSSDADTVTINPLGVQYGTRLLSTGCTQSSSPTAMNVAIDAISGESRYVIVHTDTRSMSCANVKRVFQVRDPNDFAGFWETMESWATFRLMAGSQFVPALSNLRTTFRPYIDVPDAGTTASVGTIYGGGALQKTGAGELIVKGTSGYDSRIYAESGTVTLAGIAVGEELSNILQRATFHIDASVTDTLVFAEDGTSVTNWLDVRKNGLAAHRPPDKDLMGRGATRVSYTNLGLPRLSAEKSPTGLSYVNFGARTPEGVATFGPTNCLMKLPADLSIREAFFVVRYHEPIVSNPVLGNNGRYDFHPNGTGGLFGGSTPPDVANGDLRMNGQRITYSETLGTNLNVVSIGTLEPATSTYLGTSDFYCERSGGFLLGELIFFDKPLTRPERLRIDNYLRDKWLRKGANAAELAVGQVMLAANQTALGVSSGATASVADLVAAGDVVKTGEGTLVVERLSPTNATIDVQAGQVRFAQVTAEVSDNPQPAANAYIHLEATSNLVTQTEDDKTVVTSWGDVRSGVNRSATTPDASPNKPFVVANAAGSGLDAVSFGGIGYSWMAFPNWDMYGNSNQVAGDAYAGFMVLKLNSSGSYIPFFGSSNSDMTRSDGNYHGRLVSSTYGGPTASAALWTIDGEIVDPWEYRPQDFSQTTRFMVIGFSGSEPCRVDGLAKLRASESYASSCGGIQIGEVLVYNRPISDLERRETEAYLMKKWLGKSLPAHAPQPTLHFADTTAAVIDADVDATGVAVTGGDGSLVKRGEGSVSVAALPEDVQDLTVEQGTLTISVPTNNFLNEALFHFDALDEDTLVTAHDETLGDYLAQWKDVRDNGIVADTVVPGDSRSRQDFVKTTPKLVQCEMDTGVTRPMLFFGSVLGGDSAAMWMNREFLNVRESHLIYKDKSKNSLFLSHSQYNPSRSGTGMHVDYFRNSTGSYYGNAASAAVTNGTFWSNGTVVANPATDLLPTTPSLVSIRATGNTAVNSIQEDRGVPGGAYVGEEIAFSRVLTDAERGYLQNLMMYKWFADRAKPVWTNAAYASIRVADGARLAFDGGEVVIGALIGAGAIDATSVVGVSQLTVDLADARAGKALTVSGKVAFDSAVTVRVTGSAAGIGSGETRTILTAAGGLENVDLTSWTLVMEDTSAADRFALVRSGNRILLQRIPFGLMMLVR